MTDINTVTLPLTDVDAIKLAQLPVDATPQTAPLIDYADLKKEPQE